MNISGGWKQGRVMFRADTPLLASVLDHEYEAWADAPFSIDTALMSPVQAVSIVTQHLIAGRG